jgi:hypothetical protein
VIKISIIDHDYCTTIVQLSYDYKHISILIIDHDYKLALGQPPLEVLAVEHESEGVREGVSQQPQDQLLYNYRTTINAPRPRAPSL